MNPKELADKLFKTPVRFKTEALFKSQICLGDKNRFFITEISTNGPIQVGIGHKRFEGCSAWHSLSDFEFIK